MENITTIFLDIDGTLTDGKVYLDNGKNEFKSFDVKDGLMVVSTIELGYDIIIMTGRQSQVVARRAEELGIKEFYQGIRNKKEAVEKLMEEKGFSYENLAYLGDDLNDYAVMDKCAFAGCPADAVGEIKDISDFISEFKGGNGAVREILSYILQKKGDYEKVLGFFK